MKARIGRNADGNYQLFIGQFSIITVKTRQQAEAVREVAKDNLVMLSELTKRDLIERAGFRRSQCVSDEKDRRIGLIWGRGATDRWNLIPKPTIEHDDLPDSAVLSEDGQVAFHEEMPPT